MADKVIENLITKLSFNFDEEKLKKFDGYVKDAAKGLAAIVAAATAASVAIFAFTKSIAESNDELGKFAQRVGIDVEALQELGFVAELNGGSVDSMSSSLENLSKITSEAARGIGAGVEVFGMLGLSVSNANGKLKTADEMLLDVSDAISGLGSQAEKLEFAQKLGIGGDLLLAIQQGSEAIKKQRQEARELGFVIDKNATVAAADFVDELLKVEKVITGISSAISTKLMKQITPMVKIFTEWFKANKLIIQQNLNLFLEKAIVTIQGVFTVLSRVAGIVLNLVSAMGGWKATIITVTGLLIAMNASALLMPILAIAAGAGILLLIEDLIVFAKGGDSALGNLAKKFPVLDSVLRTMLDLLAMVRDGWVLIFTDGGEAMGEALLMLQNFFKEYSTLESALKTIWDLLKMVFEGWGLIFTNAGAAFDGFVTLIKDAGKAITDFFLAPIDKVVSLLNKIPGVKIGGGIGVGESVTRTEQGRAAGGIAGISNNNQSTVNNTTTTNKPNVSITINGGDTSEVKKIITDVLSEQYSGAQKNLESQVGF